MNTILELAIKLKYFKVNVLKSDGGFGQELPVEQPAEEHVQTNREEH